MSDRHLTSKRLQEERLRTIVKNVGALNPKSPQKITITIAPKEPPKFLQSPNGLDRLVREFIKKNRVFDPEIIYADRGHIAVLQWIDSSIVMYGPRPKEYQSFGCMSEAPRDGREEMMYRADGTIAGNPINLEVQVTTHYTLPMERTYGGTNREVVSVRIERHDTDQHWFVCPAKK
ncbi:MAG: hypothetical protein Q7R96_00300 [Nanoarchaeota archaeon]|nr:hypothetical protein [Nanoarchaeota archaeon]